MNSFSIALTGIQSNGSSIGPAGNHLRWAFPPQLGFPSGGFAIYRRASIAIDHSERLDFSLNGTRNQDVVFSYPSSSKLELQGSILKVKPPSAGLLELRFRQPVVYVQLTVGKITAPIQLHAYVGQQLITSSEIRSPLDDTGTLTVTAPLITRVTIPLQFGSLNAVHYRPLAGECSDKYWDPEPVAHLPLLTEKTEALKRLRNSRLINRYVSNGNDAIERYTDQLDDLLYWLQLLQNPSSPKFDNPGAAPHELRLLTSGAGHPIQTLEPQSMLLLAALDPNIASLLSLYWVDTEVVPTDPRETKVKAYDYKVKGFWGKDQSVYCGLLFGLGSKQDPLPRVDGTLEGNQLPGLRFQGTEPLGRVGLRWPRPNQGQGATQPVLFDLARLSSSYQCILTKEMPVLVSASAWDTPDTALFIDNKVALDKYAYEVRPIDLFGQVGEWIQSDSIIVKDLEAPPPPVRLRAITTQSGYPWLLEAQKTIQEKENIHVVLRFEYGNAQHRQAPDAQAFQLYYRTESLFERHSVTVRVSETKRLPDNQKVYTVQIDDVSSIKPAQFVGGVLAKQGSIGEQVSANQRQRYRIACFEPPHSLQLAPTKENLTDGIYQIASDPHMKSTWVPWNVPILVQPALLCSLKQVSDQFEARAAVVQVVGSTSSSLISLPAAHRPQTETESPEVVEVLLDQELLEPDLFSGGTLVVGDKTIPILYSTSGPAYNAQNQASAARLGVPLGSSVYQNAQLSLRPAATTLVRTLTLQATIPDALKVPGGEVAFDVLADGSNELSTYVARVMTPYRQENASQFSVLVRLLSPTALTALMSGIQHVSYYAPYLTIIRAGLGAATASTQDLLPVPFLAKQGTQNLYLAVTTLDKNNNESPISSPVQVSIVKPPPTGAPSMPYPCGQTATAAGYATPPDLQGRATLCLTWDTGTLSNREGLRYEVARALDNTILTTHRRDWLQGKLEDVGPVTGGYAIQGLLLNIARDERSLHTATVTVANLDGHEPSAFRGGRLSQGNNHFQITAIASTHNGALHIVLQSMAQGVPTEGAATLYTPPDYRSLQGDSDALRQLATITSEAFSLVTGVPIHNSQFRDEIPGIGNNRFYYRVRAVDAAENRSAWSEVSMPFYQADTTPPDAPHLLSVTPGDRSAELSWLPLQDSRVTGYRIYRNRASAQLLPKPHDTPYAEISIDQASPRRLRMIGDSVTLPIPISLQIAAGLNDAQIQEHISTQIKVQAQSDNRGINLYVASSNCTRLEARQICALNPLIPDGTPIVVALGNEQVPQLITHRPGSAEPLVVSDQGVDLSFAFTVAEIKELFLAEEEPETADPAASNAPNLLNNPSVSIDNTALFINGLTNPDLEGSAVVAIVRLSDNRLLTIRHAPGTLQPLRIQAGQVHLNLLESELILRGVYRLEQDTPLPWPLLSVQQQDLCIRHPSETVYETVEADTVGSATIRIRTLTRLNPLTPQNTALQVTIGQSHVAADPTQLTWDDNALIGGEQYNYCLAAVKTIMLGSANLGEAPHALQIVGPKSNTLSVNALDWSTPACPVITEVTWIDEGGNATTDATTASLARIVIEASPEITQRILLQRRSGNAASWQSALFAQGRGWQDWPTAHPTWIVQDRNNETDRSWSYRVQLMTFDGRISEYSDEVVLAALVNMRAHGSDSGM